MPLCILCGNYTIPAESRELSNREKFLPLFSLHKKILQRRDHILKSYVAHTNGALTVLARGNGWHEISCFSLPTRQRKRRTLGVLNGKLYWDDFQHHHEHPGCDGMALTPSQINMLMGIKPAERRAVPAKTRRLVLERHGNRCARCGTSHQLELHHRLEVIHGGTNDPDNLVPLCRSCRTRHAAALTEHIWPDLQAIFLRSEEPVQETPAARAPTNH